MHNYVSKDICSQRESEQMVVTVQNTMDSEVFRIVSDA